MDAHRLNTEMALDFKEEPLFFMTPLIMQDWAWGCGLCEFSRYGIFVQWNTFMASMKREALKVSRNGKAAIA